MRAPARRLLATLPIALPIMAAASMISARPAAAAAAQSTPQIHDQAAFTESGEASWYGPRHQGLRTTSGERFDSTKLTAAHPSLPMGAYVRVTLAEGGRSIVVRVNDREPPHGVRCIDLSRAAAAKLGFVGRGVADVTLAQLTPDEARLDSAQEVAEAPDDAVAPDASTSRFSAPHGLRHRRRAHR